MATAAELKSGLTAERLRQIFNYDPLTGVFTRIQQKGRRNNRKVGHAVRYGYIQIEIDHVAFFAHRLAWLYMTGEWPENEIDHRNNDVADQSFANLREANHFQNMQNKRFQKNNTSGFTGVSRKVKRNKVRWQARICVDWKPRHLGYFATPELAAEAYAKAKRELHTFNPEPAKKAA